MMRKPLLITVLILALVIVAILLLQRKNVPETYSVPEDAQTGDLTPFDPCEHQPGKHHRSL